MQKTLLLSILLFAGATICFNKHSYCQTAIPADTIKSMLLNDWVRAKAYTGDYLKAMPANKYGFKASDSVRSFAQQMLHLAQTNLFFVSILKSEKLDFTAPELETIRSAQSADSVNYYVNLGYDAVINLLTNTKATELMKPTTLNMDKPYTATMWGWILKAFEHQTHHRGQTTIYLRLAGVRPPQERLF